MRVKSHQLPMTMRRATDPRMESLPADGEGRGWLGGCSSGIQEENADCVQSHFDPKGVRILRPVSAFAHRFIFRLESKHFQMTVCKRLTRQAEHGTFSRSSAATAFRGSEGATNIPHES